jgi:ribosomal-protein-alanine N-acetyltransferase
MDQFEIVPIWEKSIPEILRLADEGRLSPWTEEDYRMELGRDDSIALQLLEKQTGKIGGFIVMRLITNDDKSFHSEAEILNITVDSDYRNLGLGSNLLRAGITIATEHSPANIWLEVRSSNIHAIRFYEKHGFTQEYVRRNFYSNPVEDGMVMKLAL